MKKLSQIKLGVLLSYAMILFNIIAGLLYTPWMINKIGKSDYGIYILVVTFLNYFVVDFGMYQAINKLLSEFRVTNQREEENKVISVASRIYLTLDIVVLFILVLIYHFVDLIFINLTENELYKFKIVFLISGLFGVLSFPFGFLKGIYQAHEFYAQTKIFDFIQRVGLILFTVILLLFDFRLYALVVVYGGVPFLINILRLIYLYNKGIKFNLDFWDKVIAKKIFSISSFLLLIVLADLFLNNISPTLIATFANTEEIAIFAIGSTLYGYVYTFSNAINGLFIPRVSKFYINNQEKDLNELIRRVIVVQCVIVGFISIGIVALGDIFIDLWVGNDFRCSYYVAVLLIIPAFLVNVQQIESTYLFVRNEVKYTVYMKIFTALLSLILSCLLIPCWGAVGAGMAIGISTFCGMFIGMNIIYHLRLKTGTVNLSIILRFVLAFIGVLIIFTGIKGTSFIGVISDNRWITFLILGSIYILLYFIIVYCFVLNQDDRKKILFWK